MNSLRVPVTLLILVVLAFGAWLFYSHQIAATAPRSNSAATTSAPTVIQDQSTVNPTPSLNEAAVAAAMPGSWQSTDDPSYSIEITSNGKWTDQYKGANASSSVSETGTYTLFTSADPDPDFSAVLAQGVVYIKLVEGSDTYFYSVLQAGSGNLQLSYLARGNTLSFVKAQ